MKNQENYKPIRQQIIDSVGGEDNFIKISKIEPNKETLEEIFNNIDDKKCRYSSEESEFWHHYKIGVLDGLKEQQERSYSEEEVENILIEYVKTNPTKPYRVVSWFGQFKKK